MLSTTLTNNRVINGAVVRYKTEGNVLTLQIEGNHLIAIGTYWANVTNRMFKTPTKKSRHDRFSEYMYSLLRTYMIMLT